MTIGNDTTLPAPNGNDAPTSENTETAQVTGAPAAEVQDFDDVELEAAVAAAKAEEAGGEGGTEGDRDGALPAAAQTDTTGTKPPEGEPKPIMIPKARLDEVAGQREKALTDAAYWRGVAEARANGQAAPAAGQADQQQQQQQQTPEQQIAALRVQKRDLAGKFDAGEITYADLLGQQEALDDQVHTIREGLLLSKVPQPAQQQSGDSLLLEERTADLEQTYPWVGVFEQVANQTGNEADWDWLISQAKANLTARGVELAKNDRVRLELRTEISRLADQYGPAMLSERAKKLGIEIPGTKPPSQGQQQQQQAQLSPAAKARQDGLRKAAGAPPDINSMTGSADDTAGTPSDARIEAMDEDSIGALPQATRNRMMGITP